MGRRLIDVIKELDPKEPTIGSTIRAFRKSLGLTMQNIEDLTGIPQSNQSAIENDKMDIGIKRARLLSAALGVHPETILFPNGLFVKTDEELEIERKSKELIEAS